MGNFWAVFREINGNTFRYDTRIYLEAIQHPSVDDFCIGAVIEKNPGSAKPDSSTNHGLQEIDLDGDKLLPTVKNIIIKAHRKANIPIKSGSYVQVLNLIYLCEKDLSEAIRKSKTLSENTMCDCEKKYFPFVWYVWGIGDRNFKLYNGGSKNIDAERHFYFDNTQGKIIEGKPSNYDNARHTQGLKHDLVVPFVSKLLST